MIFVSCPGDLEPLLKEELARLGVSKMEHGFRGVYVPQEMDLVYKINYSSRIASRVLWPLAKFSCPDKEALYREVKKIDWAKYLSLGQTFAIDANVSHKNLTNSLFAALVVKDAIADFFYEKSGKRPSVNVANPDVQLNLFIHNTTAILSLDTSGAPLYKRGYRTEGGVAPLQESLAAALLTLAGFSEEDSLCDPFCGSGTFLIEAAMITTQTPAGFFRKKWGFVNMPEYSEEEWLKVKEAYDSKRTNLTKRKIWGADINSDLIGACRDILARTGFEKVVRVECKDVGSFEPKEPTLLMTNPPYGKRLEASIELYRSLGDFIQKQTHLRGAFALATNPNLIKACRVPSKKSFSFKSGGLDVTLYSFVTLKTPLLN